MWIIFIASLLLCHNSLGDLIVQIQDGKVEGTTFDTPSGKTFYAWRGIPYGKPPLGELRFQAPQKAEPWEGVRNASTDSPACVFVGTFPGDPEPINGHSEDCLYINVYSPVPVGTDSKVDPTRTVMFWIYGGGFSTGSGDFAFFDPTPFLVENVIMVTFNYRLSTLGFLSTGDEAILGNAGLKDQLLALKWVNDNIASFGGNPSDITIFGESAGAMSVGYHIVSPLSRNLFKSAIMESGCAIIDTLQSNPRDFAYKLAMKVDSSITTDSSSTKVREVLQAADANLLINLTGSEATGRIGPAMEVESEFSFLTKPLYETLEAGDIAKVPIIIGHNSEESLISVSDEESLARQAEESDSNSEILLPNMKLQENVTAKMVGDEIYRQYVGNNGSFVGNLALFLEYSSDTSFIRSTHKHAMLQSKFSTVYMYQFSFYGTLSKNHLNIPGAGKVAHMDEVGYLFNSSSRVIKTAEDYLTRSRFVKLWTNFAKYSNPTPDDDSAELLQNVKWLPVSTDDVHYLDIDDNLEVKPSRKINEAIFWDYLWETYSYRPYNIF